MALLPGGAVGMAPKGIDLLVSAMCSINFEGSLCHIPIPPLPPPLLSSVSPIAPHSPPPPLTTHPLPSPPTLPFLTFYSYHSSTHPSSLPPPHISQASPHSSLLVWISLLWFCQLPFLAAPPHLLLAAYEVRRDRS